MIPERPEFPTHPKMNESWRGISAKLLSVGGPVVSIIASVMMVVADDLRWLYLVAIGFVIHLSGFALSYLHFRWSDRVWNEAVREYHRIQAEESVRRFDRIIERIRRGSDE